MTKTAPTEIPVTADETTEDAANAERVAALKAKLKKFALIGAATLVAGTVVAVIVAKTRNSDLPEITNILPTE